MLKKYTFILIGAAICFSAGRFLGPARVEIREVEKVVVKETGEKKIVEHTVETKKPDGSSVKETTKTTESKKHKNTESDTSTERIETNRPTYQVSLFSTIRRDNVEPLYGAMVSRRLFSEVYIGAFATNQNQIGLSLSIGF